MEKLMLVLMILTCSFIDSTDIENDMKSSSECGKSVNCFRGPSNCSSITTCDFLIQFKYDSKNESVRFTISSKHKWVSFGLRKAQHLSMDGNVGETCTRNLSIASVIQFSTAGHIPKFHQAIGLSHVTTKVINGSIICRYERHVAVANGTNLRDLSEDWYLTVSFGSSIRGGVPSRHRKESTATSQNSVNFITAPTIIKSKKSLHPLKVAHGCLMTLAWLSFATIGISIARYMRPLWSGDNFAGHKIWFQLHRFCMVMTLLLTIIGFIAIFIKERGWKPDDAGVHAYTGVLTVAFGILQPVIATLRPSSESQSRWIFNIAHRITGLVCLITAAITVLLGCILADVDQSPVIVWIVLVVLLIFFVEMLSKKGPRSNKIKHLRVKAKEDSTDKESDDDQAGNPTKKLLGILLTLSSVSFFATGFTMVGLVIKRGV